MAEESSEVELADATRVRVMETNLLHASDVIYWLDGSSADTPAAMSRIEIPLHVTFTEKPKAIQYLHSLGKTAFGKHLYNLCTRAPQPMQSARALHRRLLMWLAMCMTHAKCLIPLRLK